MDASVAVKWELRDEQFASASARLLERYSRGEVELIAPDHIRYELASAVTLATQGANARLTVQDGQDAIAEFLALGLITVGADELILAAYPLVHQFGIAIYDALYLALAFQTRYPLITADGKLYDRIRQLPLAMWVSDPRVQR